MSGMGPAKLQAALAECALHARVLAEARARLPSRFDADDACHVNDELRRTLDQTAYRFMKLQDSLGEKVLPGLLAETLDPLPPEAPFAQRLQRLERLGALPSVETWRLLREVRNGLAHDYPDQPALQAAAWNRLHVAIDDLLAVWRAVVTFRARVNPGS
jgi:hypothetical protein